MPNKEKQSEQQELQAGRAKDLLASFGYAGAGLKYVLFTQRNFRIHVAVALLSTLLAFFLGLSYLEWALFTLLVVLVLAAEMVNTMVEALVDLVTSEFHPLAKIAKDVSAGVVLLTAIGAVVVGLLLFGPKLLQLLRI